jgi:hypothetical protein
MLMRKTFKLGLFAIIAGCALFFALFSASIYTFNVLTDEALIAELRFEQLGPERYLATLKTGNGCYEQTFEILGQQWRIDAEFVKWKYWATLLGLDAQYRLDRLEGRYLTIADQNSRERLAHDLRPSTTVDLVALANGLGSLNMLVDATYGSSTYQDIDTARLYRVYRTQTGIITRSEPRPQRDPASGLAVEISRACGGGPGIWYRVSNWTDSAVQWMF